MKIKMVDPQGVEIKQEVKVPVTPPNVVPSEGSIEHQQVAQLFDLNLNELNGYKSKLNTLIDYAKSITDDHSPEGLKWAIRDLSFKVGTPPLGQKSIDYLTLYAHTRTKRDKLNKQLEKFERPQ